MVNILQKLFLTLYEQLIVGYMPINFISWEIILKWFVWDIISYDIDNSKILFYFLIER